MQNVFKIACKAEQELTDGIAFLQQELHYEVAEEGFPVIFQKEGEGTCIEVKKEETGAVITYGRKAGAFRGLFLLMAHRDEESFCIQERCCFQDFATMIDMSRNAVMHRDGLKRLISKMACMGYESMQLYTEDTLKIEGETYMGYGRGAYTCEEIKEIDSFAQMLGVELIPCIQCLAHLNQLCIYSRYSLMMDMHDILMVGEPRTYEFIEHLFQTISKCFTSRKVNVGMDEAGSLGRGNYLEKHGYRPRAEIMAEHTKRVNEIAEKYGFTMSMWSDMFYNLLFKEDRTAAEEETLQSIPESVRLIYWDYGTTDVKTYEEKMANHLRITSNVAFAGGSWKWWGLVPNNAHAILTQKSAIAAAKAQDIQHYILTCWGDNGAEASNFAVLPCMFAVARMTYERKGADGWLPLEWEALDEETKAAYEKEFLALTGLSWEDFMKVECMNRLDMDPAVTPFNNANKYFLYNDPLKGMFDSLAKEEYAGIYAQHAQTLREVRERSGEYAYLFDALAKLADVLELKVCLGVDIRRAYEAKDSAALRQIAGERIPEILKRIESFYDAFCTQWHTDNKSFGFDVQCVRIGGLKQRLQYVQRQLEAYADGSLSEIMELEEASLPFGLYLGHSDANQLYFNDWRLSTTPNCL